MLWPAVDADHAVCAGALLADPEAELGGDPDLAAHRLQRLAEQDLVLVWAVDLGRIEEIDADLDGAVQGGDRVLFRLPAIAEAHAHAAEPDRIDRKRSEFALFHRCVSCLRCGRDKARS